MLLDQKSTSSVMQEDNVRVAVRVRPLLAKEKLSGEQRCVKVLPESKQILVGKDRLFAYDYVISPQEKQEAVYERCIDGLVVSCFEGYNATVFAYGQTGSGKTYTIGGTSSATHTEEEVGVLPRALRQMFCLIEENSSRRSYQVTVSYLELYMEELRDLLDLSTSSKDITIREDELGNTVVSGMREVPCRTIDEVLYCLHHGSAARQTGSTQMNEHSSRSHSVFTVTIQQHWEVEEQSEGEAPAGEGSGLYHHVCSKFHFVDLAGSERAHRTGNVGDRFKESIHINTGLLVLGNVISALGDPKKKSSHIPYRDSKIARLLKDSLGGNAKTLMICCISPAACDFDETLNALKYANRARNIKNKPVVNRDCQSLQFEEMQNEIEALRRELQKRDTMLQEDILLSGRDVHLAEMSQLEEKINRLQKECLQYTDLLVATRDHLEKILSLNILSSSLQNSVLRLVQLLHTVLEMPCPGPEKGPFTADHGGETTDALRKEIKKYAHLLKNDEEIFVDKSRQLVQFQKENAQLNADKQSLLSELEATRGRCQELEEALLEQQMKIEQLSSVNVAGHGSSPPATSRRAKSVPAPGDRLHVEERMIHTSPALFSLERVMQGFRARSQILIERLDDEDEVLQKNFGCASEEQDLVPDIGLNHVGNAKKSPRERRRTRTLSFGDVVIRQQSEDSNGEMTDVRVSMDKHQREIRQAKLRSQEFNSRLRDLTIAIRMKEQLIRQLVKNEKDSAEIAKQHREKITQLEEEKEKTTRELQELHREFEKLEVKEKIEVSSKKKLQAEFKKKIENAKRKLSSLQVKEKETSRLANMTERTDEKIRELQLATAKMRQQQEELQRKLKQEHEKKEKLEKDMQREQQRVKELENITEQQQKILKIKTEEVAAATRRLRSNSTITIAHDDDSKLAEQKRWLDVEMEKIIEQRRQMEELQKELAQRAEIISKREEVLREKGQLEMKILRESPMLKVSEKDLQLLRNEKLSAEKERKQLDQKLLQAGVLSSDDERRVLELSEAMEALDAAMEYKNEIIAGKEADVRRSHVLDLHENNLMNRLNSLNVHEAQRLLAKYFDKVIQLKEEARESDNRVRGLEMQMEEQSRMLAELDFALEGATTELDRQLTEQQQQYEEQINVLLQQQRVRSPVRNRSPGSTDNEASTLQANIRVQQLEKDLYYYKKTSRDLKKKLREVMIRLGEQAAGGSLDHHGDHQIEDSKVDSPRLEYHDQPVASMSPTIQAIYTSNDGQHVKISRKDLRRMSQEEVQLRRSSANQSVPGNRTSTDSLENGRGAY